MRFQAPKGCRDFYPEDMRVREWIFDCWKRVSVRNGFEPYDGPIFEDLDLYRVKSGDEIVSELFHFTDRGGREFALRPEMTPTLARMVAAKANALPKPIRWYSVPRLCRAEKPQRGRLREFFQWNIDILGEDDPTADADCIFVMIDFLREVGLTSQQAAIKINSRAVVTSVLEANDFAPQDLGRIYTLLDKRDKVSAEAFAEMVKGLGAPAKQAEVLLHLGEASAEEGLQRVRALLGDAPAGVAAFDHLSRTLELLDRMGVGDYCQLDMSVVRGLAYYTGVVFEGFGKGGLQRAICGGGRYDRLLADLGGPPMGGVGFATSDVVIQDVIEEFGLLPAFGESRGLFVIDADPQYFDGVLKIAAELRRRNHTATYSYKRQPLGKQLKQASSRQAARVVIVDAQTSPGGTVGLKDMDSGVQQQVTVEALLENPYRPLVEGSGLRGSPGHAAPRSAGQNRDERFSGGESRIQGSGQNDKG